MATEATVDKMPDCDLCSLFYGRKRVAKYDGKTRGGPWGYMCEECFQSHGVGLGTGRGQKLVLRKSDG